MKRPIKKVIRERRGKLLSRFILKPRFTECSVKHFVRSTTSWWEDAVLLRYPPLRDPTATTVHLPNTLLRGQRGGPDTSNLPPERQIWDILYVVDILGCVFEWTNCPGTGNTAAKHPQCVPYLQRLFRPVTSNIACMLWPPFLEKKSTDCFRKRLFSFL